LSSSIACTASCCCASTRRASASAWPDSEALDAAARTLMDACRVLLDEDVAEPLRDAVFAAVKREELADAVGAMARLARLPG
jgi:hypothetical protein